MPWGRDPGQGRDQLRVPGPKLSAGAGPGHGELFCSPTPDAPRAQQHTPHCLIPGLILDLAKAPPPGDVAQGWCHCLFPVGEAVAPPQAAQSPVLAPSPSSRR